MRTPTRDRFYAFWQGLRITREFLDTGFLRTASLGRRDFGISFDLQVFSCYSFEGLKGEALAVAEMRRARECRLAGNYQGAWESLWAARKYRCLRLP